MRHIIDKLIQWCRGRGHGFPGQDFVTQNRVIYRELTELRALIGADRAYVIQFHNGSEFLLSNPVWKLTCTHEVVRPGVTYEAGNMQGLLVSQVSDLISPILLGESDTPGITMSPTCGDCPDNKRCQSAHKSVCVVTTSALPHGWVKHWQESRGASQVVMCGLSSPRGAYGSLVAGWTAGTPDDPDTVTRRICVSAENIRFALDMVSR